MLSKQIGEPIRHSGTVLKEGLRLMTKNPGLLVYAYAATIFIGITYPIISVSILHRLYNDIFVPIDVVAPHRATSILGLVAFSVFYAALVTAYFTCATAASVQAQLEGHPIPLLAGLQQIAQHFWRVTRFAVLSIFLFPMGVYAQRRKLPRGIVGVIGSSVTLHMAQMAPAILSTKQPMGATVRDCVDTLGESWREGLILKIGMYATVFVVVVLPKLIQHGFFHGRTASNVGWLLSIELATSGYVIFKIIYTVFTTVLYHRVKQKQS